jgi:hypothetical protein
MASLSPLSLARSSAGFSAFSDIFSVISAHKVTISHSSF